MCSTRPTCCPLAHAWQTSFTRMYHVPKSAVCAASMCRVHVSPCTWYLSPRMEIWHTGDSAPLVGYVGQRTGWSVVGAEHPCSTFSAGSSSHPLGLSQWRNELPSPSEPFLPLTIQSLLWKSLRPALLAMPVNPTTPDTSTYSALHRWGKRANLG